MLYVILDVLNDHQRHHNRRSLWDGTHSFVAQRKIQIVSTKRHHLAGLLPLLSALYTSLLSTLSCFISPYTVKAQTVPSINHDHRQLTREPQHQTSDAVIYFHLRFFKKSFTGKLKCSPPMQHTHLALGPLQAVTNILNGKITAYSSPLNKLVRVDEQDGRPRRNKVLDCAVNQVHQNKHRRVLRLQKTIGRS